MRSRFDEKLLCILFCAFLGAVSLLFFVLPKEEFSEAEKRYLAESPDLSLEGLTSGELGENIESYMADHIPAREFFVGLNSYMDLFTGRQVSKEVYLAEGGRLVQAPVVWNDAQAKQNIGAINSFAEAIGEKIDFMVVPSAGWAAEEIIMGPSYPFEDEKLIERLYGLCSDKIVTFDILSVFEETEEPYSLYYKTDHHWTAEGAFTAYEAYMKHLGRNYRGRDSFTVRRVENFKGSTYSESALWLTGGETLELWQGSENLTVTNGESSEVHKGVFYEERLKEADKYTVYLDGNHSVVRISNPEKEGKILVVRDSYSNCLGTMLAESYGEVVLVDLRYYKKPVSELCSEEGFDDILVCYSMENIMTDTNLIWLK